MADREHRESGAKGGLAGLGIAAFAIACCSSFPIVVSLAGGVAIGTLLGVGAGFLAAAGATIVLVVWLRRRRAAACARPTEMRTRADDEASELAQHGAEGAGQDKPDDEALRAIPRREAAR